MLRRSLIAGCASCCLIDEAYQFDRIMSVERLSDGRWAVADMGSSQIRYYDEDGTHLYSVGRNGDDRASFDR